MAHLMKHSAPETTQGPMLVFMLGVWGLVFAFILGVVFLLPLLEGRF